MINWEQALKVGWLIMVWLMLGSIVLIGAFLALSSHVLLHQVIGLGLSIVGMFIGLMYKHWCLPHQ